MHFNWCYISAQDIYICNPAQSHIWTNPSKNVIPPKKGRNSWNIWMHTHAHRGVSNTASFLFAYKKNDREYRVWDGCNVRGRICETENFQLVGNPRPEATCLLGWIEIILVFTILSILRTPSVRACWRHGSKCNVSQTGSININSLQPVPSLSWESGSTLRVRFSCWTSGVDTDICSHHLSLKVCRWFQADWTPKG